VILRIGAALVLGGASSVALGAEVVDSRFQVEFTRGEQTYSYSDTVVPYLPDSACYFWYLRFDPATKEALSLVETLTLPEPLAAWIDFQNDPAATTQINADGQGATTTLNVTPNEDGWVSHGWCVAAGDPLGGHRLAVALDGAEIGGWDFTVVAEADYAFEAPVPTAPQRPDEPAPPPPPQPSPTARDVNQSW
jgi:hypothetical protein